VNLLSPACPASAGRVPPGRDSQCHQPPGALLLTLMMHGHDRVARLILITPRGKSAAHLRIDCPSVPVVCQPSSFACVLASIPTCGIATNWCSSILQADQKGSSSNWQGMILVTSCAQLRMSSMCMSQAGDSRPGAAHKDPPTRFPACCRSASQPADAQRDAVHGDIAIRLPQSSSRS